MSASKQEIILKILTHHPADLLCTPQFHQKLQTGPSVLSVLCQVWFCQHKSHGVLPGGGGSKERLASSGDRKGVEPLETFTKAWSCIRVAHRACQLKQNRNENGGKGYTSTEFPFPLHQYHSLPWHPRSLWHPTPFCFSSPFLFFSHMNFYMLEKKYVWYDHFITE